MYWIECELERMAFVMNMPENRLGDDVEAGKIAA